MQINFTKMQGCGNDYVYINGFTEIIPQQQKPDFVRKMSDRHFGIGGDGVIFVNPSQTADFEMEMYNADGTRAEMCGNGIRCVGKFVYDKGLTDKTDIRVESFGKVKYLQLLTEGGTVKNVRVNMGEPILKAEEVPVVCDKEQAVSEPVVVEGKTYEMTCVSMGNPHAVVYMEDVAGVGIEKIGPFFENHPRFPRRVNTEFVKVLDKNTVEMRVWERGTGETLACGTGCCAVAVACVLNGLTGRKVTVKVLGGQLDIEWEERTNLVYMTGPAVTVFEGSVDFSAV